MERLRGDNKEPQYTWKLGIDKNNLFSVPRLLAEVAQAKGLPVSIEEYEARFFKGNKPQPEILALLNITATPEVLEVLDRLVKTDEVVIELANAASGGELKKPSVDYPNWNPDFKRQIMALWWSRRKNLNKAKRRTQIILKDKPALTPEAVKAILGQRLDTMLNSTLQGWTL